MRVGIIGGGVAGLTLAIRITEAGHVAMVIDKGRAIGGRVTTRQWHDHAFDHGAQYFTVRDPKFRAFLDDHVPASSWARWDGRFASLEGGRIVAEEPDQPPIRRRPRHVRDPPGARGARPLSRADAGRPAGRRARELGIGRRGGRGSRAVRLGRGDGGGPPGPTSVIHSSPEWARAHLSDSQPTIHELLREAASEAFGVDFGPDSLGTVHRWLYARPAEPLGRPCLVDFEARLAACGDWCLAAKVEGAFLGGDACADAILGRSAG